VAGKIYKAGMSLLVIDTENKFVSTGFAKEIARVAQGTPVMTDPSNAFDTSFFFFEISQSSFSLLNCPECFFFRCCSAQGNIIICPMLQML